MYICIYKYMCIYIYIYIYVLVKERPQERARGDARRKGHAAPCMLARARGFLGSRVFYVSHAFSSAPPLRPSHAAPPLRPSCAAPSLVFVSCIDISSKQICWFVELLKTEIIHGPMHMYIPYNHYVLHPAARAAAEARAANKPRITTCSCQTKARDDTFCRQRNPKQGARGPHTNYTIHTILLILLIKAIINSYWDSY